MIACINPHDAFMDENISTLTYATKASYITNQPVVNDDPRTKVINQLRRQVKDLNEELSKANQHIEFISNFPQSNNPAQISSSRQKPSTETSQKLKSEEQELLPQPLFKKRLTERIGMSHGQGFNATAGGQSGNYDQFS